jgi:LCP family protein required for cell wall assembly
VVPGASFRHFIVRFAIALVVVGVTGSAAFVAGNERFERSVERIPTVDLDPDVLAPEEKGEPANFLIVGSDSRAFVDNEAAARAFGTAEDVGGERSDTLMVVHVEPATKTGFVVSFPRDLWVTLPGHGEGRINKAFGLGGPKLVIETLATNYDVPVHHYLEVDFAGFERIVDTLGGVDIWFPTPARDVYSGLAVDTAGCRELDGSASLAYVRSRHYQYFDEERGAWRNDPRSDLSRIERQQYFMRSLAHAAIRRGARNPQRAFALLDRMVDTLKRDEQLGVGDMRGLINAFRDLDPASIEMLTVPTESVRRGGASVLLPKRPESDPLFERLRSFGLPTFELPELALPEETPVTVRNGSGRRGAAAEVLAGLVGHGFVAAAEPRDADRDDYPLTQVRYPAGAAGAGLLVASYLGTHNVVEERFPDPRDGGAVVVIVGRDWPDLAGRVKEDPAAPTSGPPPAPSATTSSIVSTTTTTRAVSPSQTAVVPVDPDTGGPLVGCPS